MSQDHSINWMYQALLAPGKFLKPVQIPRGQFHEAEGCRLTRSGAGPTIKVVAGPGEVMLAEEEGFCQGKRLILPCG